MIKSAIITTMTNTKKGIAALSIGALGVVFGDIGTSPLYALQAVFGLHGERLAINQENVYGIISLIIWSITLVVSIKFIGFIMRADNEGEGGILALTALIKSSKLKANYKWFFIFLGLVGVSLFYGDSVITPAISVLSAVEGVKVVAPHLSSLVLPVTLIILAALFGLQRYGTGLIGKLFGPVMLIWFFVIGAGGTWQIWLHPGILRSLSPLTAIKYFGVHPLLAFVAMTAVVLAITGVEALYADMGHFGRPPISRAWFFIVFPALTLCYMGQGALILYSPSTSANSLVQLFPDIVRIPVIILATMATVIASQAVISGAFSLTRQAIQLEFLPKMLIRHTSDLREGQIYLPFINLIMFILVATLVLSFGSSARLANAYGIAVSGTLAADTILFLVVMRSVWQKRLKFLFLVGLVFIPLDLLFVTSNSEKIFHGGLFPIIIGAIVFLLINTWTKGDHVIDSERRAMEGPLQDFVNNIHSDRPALKRIPGVAIYVGHHPDFTPMALIDTVSELHELPSKVVIVSVQTTNTAHVANEQRIAFDDLGYQDGISHLTIYYGYHDVINVPKVLKNIHQLSPELDFDTSEASYFISLNRIVLSRRHNLAHWRKIMYRLMYKNALSTSDYYKLPIERTEEISTLIRL
jgi:KUP system potassium uptake protein